MKKGSSQAVLAVLETAEKLSTASFAPATLPIKGSSTTGGLGELLPSKHRALEMWVESSSKMLAQQFRSWWRKWDWSQSNAALHTLSTTGEESARLALSWSQGENRDDHSHSCHYTRYCGKTSHYWEWPPGLSCPCKWPRPNKPQQEQIVNIMPRRGLIETCQKHCEH